MVFMRGVPPRAPRLKAPLLLLVWCLPHRVVAPRQEPKIPRSYTRIFRLDGTLVDRARNTFLSGGARHSVLIDLPPDLPRAMADRRRIVQVLNNLFSNASRHAPKSLSIRVTAVREGVYIAIAVADEGRGVAPERLPRLFRKYTDFAGSERERALGATGLRLAICGMPFGPQLAALRVVTVRRASDLSTHLATVRRHEAANADQSPEHATRPVQRLGAGGRPRRRCERTLQRVAGALTERVEHARTA